jgi:cytochrome c-type biogenesis protein CcmH
MKRRDCLGLFSLVAFFVLAVGSAVAPAWAVRPDEMLSTPQFEARAHAIGEELRCLVCQNESIEDSDAELAHDLRLLVRQRVLAGDSDEQVKQYIVARYGTYVLLKPPFDAETALLWLGPALLLLCAIGVAIAFYRRSAALAPEAAPLSADEVRRVAVLAGDMESKATES